VLAINNGFGLGAFNVVVPKLEICNFYLNNLIFFKIVY
jgi:hypothetical protein